MENVIRAVYLYIWNQPQQKWAKFEPNYDLQVSRAAQHSNFNRFHDI